jgi:mRNA deadenylase 3'-5' endonuclease subunit Ccr4
MEKRSAVVAKELEKIGVDVAALQETRLEGSGMIKEK